MMNKPMKPIMMILIIVSLLFAGQGIYMHKEVSRQEAALHETQAQYFGENTKAQRDSAAANSELSGQLVDIKNAPSELLRLKLVGVGKILSGIYLLLLGILMALMSMPKRLSEVMKKM